MTSVIASATNTIKKLGWIPSESRFKTYNVYSHPDFPGSRIRLPLEAHSKESLRVLEATLINVASLHKISKKLLTRAVLFQERQRLRQRNNRVFQPIDFTKAQFIRHGIGLVQIWQAQNEFAEYTQECRVASISKLTWDKLNPIIIEYLNKLNLSPITDKTSYSQFLTHDASILLSLIFRVANHTKRFQPIVERLLLLPTEEVYFWYLKVLFSGKHPQTIISAMKKAI